MASTINPSSIKAGHDRKRETESRHIEEKLDDNIFDDHDDPHQAALLDGDAEIKVTRSTWAAVFFLGFTFQPSLTFTILFVFPVIVPIAMELQGDTSNSNWMASGWSLAGSVGFAIAGQFSDYFGRRYLLLFGQTLLVLGYIVGASANGLGSCIAAMVILGFGTGTTFVLYPAISELLPNKYRPYGLAWTELNLLPFTTLGPLLARLLVQNASWRWIFILGAITGVISITGTAIFYFPPNRPIRNLTRRQIMAQLDYPGIFFYVSGLTLFLLGLGWGGTQYPWASANVLAPMIIGACLFICTFLWDFSGRAQRPLFPRWLFSMFREYTILLIVIFVTGVVYFTLTDLMPQQITYTLTSDPTMAGLYNIPGGFGGSAGGVFLGALISKLKHVQWQIAVAIACQTIFTALQAICWPGQVAKLLVFQLFANLPFAWITLACYITASLHVPQKDLGLALGLIGTFRFLGSAIGTTIFIQILNNKATSSIASRVASAVVPLGYPSDHVPALISAISGSTTASLNTTSEIIKHATTAYQWGWGDAFHITWIATVPFGVIAFGLALFVRDPSPYFTNHTAVHLEKETLGSGQQKARQAATK
jgi:MFS family permease